ncbi:MAG: hypothetical protein IJU39_00225, partial [Clostridia bacterium]|nr:hypothetical protein [Clostridia bacterium]
MSLYLELLVKPDGATASLPSLCNDCMSVLLAQNMDYVGSSPGLRTLNGIQKRDIARCPFTWSYWSDSNRRPAHYECAAL